MDSIPALVVIAPGYFVQAWLFVTHRALGGLGHDLTIIGASATVWTLLFVGVLLGGWRLLRRVSRRH